MTETQPGKPVLTTRQGHPVQNNQQQRTVGTRGPATMENYHFLEKISHFDRERIPERVVHARGFVAHGDFEAYGTIGDEPASTYTRAKLFQTKGTKTPVSGPVLDGHRRAGLLGGGPGPARLRGQVPHRGRQLGPGRQQPAGLLHPRRDQVPGRDPRPQARPGDVPPGAEPDFRLHVQHARVDAHADLAVQPAGIPENYRTQEGFGVNTYRMVNAAGEAVLVKYHWKSRQGIESLTAAQAAQIQAGELGHASKDLYEAIEAGDFPQWELNVQIMSDDEHPELDFDPLDDTKTWPEDQFPLRPVGVMTLNRNVGDHHNENEQIAFGTGVLVDGLDFSDDKMLIGRTFSYSDTQRYRVGPNYLQLPVNRPDESVVVSTNQGGGQMSYGVDHRGGSPHINFEPSTVAGLQEADESYREYRPFVEGHVQKAPIERENNYAQAGERYRTMPESERDDLVLNMIELLGQCDKVIQQKMVWHFNQCDGEFGRRVGGGLGLTGNGA